MSDPALAAQLQALNVAPQNQVPQHHHLPPPQGFHGSHPHPPPRGGYPPRGHMHGPPRGAMHPMPRGMPPPPGMMHSPGPGGPPPPPHHYNPHFQPRGPPMAPPRPHVIQNPVQNPGVFAMKDREFNSKGYQQLRINDSKFMKGRELAQLVRMQLTAVQSGDSFADDYYFVKFAEQRRREAVKLSQQAAPVQVIAAQKAADRPATLLKEMTQLHKLGSAALGLRIGQGRKRVPLPVVRDNFADRSYVRESKRDQATREWEAENKVLGHTTKANLKRPRELIRFITEAREKGAKEESPAIFGDAAWKLRAAIENAADAVLQIEDMHRLLKARYASLPPPGSNVALTPENQRVKDQLDKLRAKQEELCNTLGTLIGFGKYEKTAEGAEEKEITIDMQQLLNIIWLPKGRRMICRAVTCLLAPHHKALMESFVQLLVYFCCTSSGDDADAADAENGKLDKLCTDTFCQEIESLSLAQLRACLFVLLEAQTPESLRALMGAQGGAGVIRTLMTCGQQLVEHEEAKPVGEKSEELVSEWSTLFAKFLEMAEEGIAAKE